MGDKLRTAAAAADVFAAANGDKSCSRKLMGPNSCSCDRFGCGCCCIETRSGGALVLLLLLLWCTAADLDVDILFEEVADAAAVDTTGATRSVDCCCCC